MGWSSKHPTQSPADQLRHVGDWVGDAMDVGGNQRKEGFSTTCAAGLLRGLGRDGDDDGWWGPLVGLVGLA